MKIRHFTFFIPLAVLFCATAFAGKQAIETDNAPPAIGPYSQGIILSNVQDLVYISGQLGFAQGEDDSWSIPKADKKDIAAQTDNIMTNIGAILEEAGLGYCDIVMSTVYLKNLKDFGDFNVAYADYFNECAAAPARATVGAKIPKDKDGARIELSVIAGNSTEEE